MGKWYQTMAPYYTRIMARDGTVWYTLSQSSGKISELLSSLRLKDRWPKFPQKMKDATLTFAHNCNIVCRIYFNHPPPDDAKLNQLMRKFSMNVGKNVSQEEKDGWHKDLDFIKEMMKGDGPVSDTFDKIWSKAGGWKGVRKILRGKDMPGGRKSREEVEAQAQKILTKVLDQVYNDDE